MAVGGAGATDPPVLKADVRSAETRLSLSRTVRILEYSEPFYPAEILASSDPLSALKLRNCWELLGDLVVF